MYPSFYYIGYIYVIFTVIFEAFFPHLVLIIYFQRLEEHITKNSPTLGRDAVYKKSVSITTVWTLGKLIINIKDLNVEIIFIQCHTYVLLEYQTLRFRFKENKESQ